MQLTIPNTFANGTGEVNIIDAPKVNANFAEVATVLNGNIEADNIKTGSAIAIKNIAQTISAAWTFSTNPVFNSGAIADSYLTSNVPLKNSANTFTSGNTFTGTCNFSLVFPLNLRVENVSANPTGAANRKGQIVYNTTDNKYYGWNGTEWRQMDYIGDYTGGAIRCYSGEGIVDDGDPYKLRFKTEGGSPTVKLFLKGEPYPKRFYTELGEHTHVFTGVAHNHAITDAGHTHVTVMGSHTHGTTQYGISTHTHGVSGSTATANIAHTHSVSGTTSGQSVTHTHALSGSTASHSIDHDHDISLTTGSTDLAHVHGVGTLVNANETDHQHGGVAQGSYDTDLAGYHTHALSGSTASALTTHTHGITGSTDNDGCAHTHGVGTLAAGNASVDHTHTFSATSGSTDPSHTHTISITSAASSSNQAIPSTDLGNKTSNNSVTGISINNQTATGNNSNTGVNAGGISSVQKLYGKSLTVKIDSTNITSNILSSTGWSAIGDGTGSHAFHTAGTGEMDASGWLSFSPGFHTLEIIEPDSGYGCSVLAHIETS